MHQKHTIQMPKTGRKVSDRRGLPSQVSHSTSLMTKVIKFRGKCVFTMPGNLPSKSAVLKLSPLCPFQNVTRINSRLESSTVFSRKILWRCLTFGAVYTITKPIYVFPWKVQNTYSFLPPLTRRSRLTVVGLDRT